MGDVVDPSVVGAVQGGFVSEDWHYVGATDEPAFENSWGPDSGFMSPAFRIREAGIVDIYGKFGGGSSATVAFTLPEGYRPSEVVPLPMADGHILVDTAGQVYLYPDATKITVVAQVFLDLPVAAP